MKYVDIPFLFRTKLKKCTWEANSNFIGINFEILTFYFDAITGMIFHVLFNCLMQLKDTAPSILIGTLDDVVELKGEKK